MDVVAPSTLPICASSQVAPLDTQLPSALSTLSTPNPATEEAAEPARPLTADPAAPVTPEATWHTVPNPAPPRASAAVGHETPGMAGSAARTGNSVHALAGVEEEVHDGRPGRALS